MNLIRQQFNISLCNWIALRQKQYKGRTSLRLLAKQSKYDTRNMLKNCVLLTVLVTVASESQVQQKGVPYKQEAGKLLRVVQNQGSHNDRTATKIFYYFPANVEVKEDKKKEKQAISALTTDPRFVESTMKLIDVTENAEGNAQLMNNEEVGVYHIYHPNGVLQRVEYRTKNEDDKMTVSTSVRYKLIEPIKGPIYTYDPQTLLYRQI